MLVYSCGSPRTLLDFLTFWPFLLFDFLTLLIDWLIDWLIEGYLQIWYLKPPSWFPPQSTTGSEPWNLSVLHSRERSQYGCPRQIPRNVDGFPNPLAFGSGPRVPVYVIWDVILPICVATIIYMAREISSHKNGCVSEPVADIFHPMRHEQQHLLHPTSLN